MQLNIKKFSLANVRDDSVIIMIGKRNCGKSTIVKDLLYHKRYFPSGIIMSATEDSNKAYQEFMPKIFIYNDYQPDVIAKIIETQKDLVKKRGKGPDTRTFLLLDDCMYNAKIITKDANMRYLFMNGRHLNLCLIITLQYMLDIPPALRTNVDYVFALQEFNLDNKERLFRYFFGIFPNKQQFFSVHEQCTQDYHCLVLDNTSRSNRLEDVIYWFKAEPNRKFKIGGKALWRFAKQFEMSEEEQDRLQQERKDAKSKLNVMVRKVNDK